MSDQTPNAYNIKPDIEDVLREFRHARKVITDGCTQADDAQPGNSDEIVELADRVMFVLREIEDKLETADIESHHECRAICLALVKGILDVPDQIIALAQAAAESADA